MIRQHIHILGNRDNIFRFIPDQVGMSKHRIGNGDHFIRDIVDVLGHQYNVFGINANRVVCHSNSAFVAIFASGNQINPGFQPIPFFSQQLNSGRFDADVLERLKQQLVRKTLLFFLFRRALRTAA